MKLSLLFLLLFSSVLSFAQSDTLYFSDEKTPTLLYENATFFSLNQLKQDGEITLFDKKTSQKFITYQYTSDSEQGSLSFNGKAHYFYPNGKLKIEGVYENNVKIGVWKAYNENGKPKETIQLLSNSDINEDNLFGYKVLEAWNNDKKIVSNGNGFYNHTDSLTTLTVKMKNGLPDGNCKGTYRNNSFSEEYKNGKLQKGEIIVNRKKIIYDKLSEYASFRGGIKAMYEFIAVNLKYPASAQRYNRQGRVYLKFLVKKDGAISDISILKGIYKDCDLEAVRVVELMNGSWESGKIRGIKEDFWFTMPFAFVLE